MPDPARQEIPPPSGAALFPLIAGYMTSQLIYVAARLGVADHLRDGAKSSEELAKATRSHAPSLRRLLRGLAVVGMVEEIEPGQFQLTPSGALLGAGVPGSVRNLAMLFIDESVWRSWGDLLHSVRTGETALEHVFGMGTFEYCARNPEFAAIFNEAMTEATRWAAPSVLAVYDFSRFRTIVDVGGGNGTLVGAILAANPGLRGIVFDLPSGVEGARCHLEAAGLGGRCEIVAGDFFVAPLPSGADAYVVKSVIHDWDDERSRAILTNCRRAMPAHGRLLLIEPVVPAKVDGSAAHRMMVMSDLNMLAVTGGRERTEAEFWELLNSTGFRLAAVVPARAPSNFSVIEGVPA
ncbi:MAG TPA: methyltransferase [Candidatus Polarisedimenticolia bacterium]|nr:methyltransferase [Candidatus Polarisedimenticolia bacterium]